MAIIIQRKKASCSPVNPIADDYLKKIDQIEKQKGLSAALAAAKAYLTEFPQHQGLLRKTAILLIENKYYEEAIKLFERIPGYEKNISILTNIGLAYIRMENFKQALDYLTKALDIKPNHLPALLNLGVAQSRLGYNLDAVDTYLKFLSIEEDNAQVPYNLGLVYGRLKNLKQSDRWYRRALELAPKNHSALANWAFTLHYMQPYDAEKISNDIKQYAQAFSNAYHQVLPPVLARNPHKKLHIGLVSSDLREHAVGYFIDGLLTSETVKQFEWSAYMTESHNDRLARRIRPLFSHWHDIDIWLDAQLVETIRSDGVDILIDLNGYTGNNRASLFVSQVVPVQLQWLGWFNTTGLPYMNGVIADEYCVPKEEARFFSEKVWYLPHTRLCMRPPRYDVSVAPLPALQNGYITFGCFQNPQKLNDEVLKQWLDIARQLPDARWHFKGKEHMPDSSRQLEFKQKLVEMGFNPERLLFSGRSSHADYFRAYNDIDLILDTFPYTGGTTTTEALWMGVPTITFTQPGMVARQGEQLLSAAGLPQFVCRSLPEYREKALYWANPTQRKSLAALRAVLREQVLQSPLFDTEKFAQDWCNLIREIWQQTCQQEAV
ncbi:putative O-linked N-acetylglucosamine transferase (SPINDLY family) [Cricetibacter osteomyelitidis]|uniref:protein O-GlcNAc transferase n=1 Tax=Cricetibacter osteomyelitidis TaxID=1521931 RepID=A0A4R2T7M2_9PAST|nr:tetratricopeptide repeat protein [Cricetibacter osteomyelitidis]TCP96854.1 putative O-linked N-acetylglucosamine transferase (SPINDLY family) [Cricetibacter osteomyelitidis]